METFSSWSSARNTVSDLKPLIILARPLLPSQTMNEPEIGLEWAELTLVVDAEDAGVR